MTALHIVASGESETWALTILPGKNKTCKYNGAWHVGRVLDLYHSYACDKTDRDFFLSQTSTGQSYSIELLYKCAPQLL